MLDIWQLLFKKTTILYRQNHPFGSENGAGIYFFRFTMQCCQVLVTGRIMADNEAFDTGFQSDICRLPCCRMECFLWRVPCRIRQRSPHDKEGLPLQ